MKVKETFGVQHLELDNPGMGSTRFKARITLEAWVDVSKRLGWTQKHKKLIRDTLVDTLLQAIGRNRT